MRVITRALEAVETKAVLGEGPTWDPRRQILWWVDLLGGRVHGHTPATGDNVVFELEQVVSAAIPSSTGDLITCLGDGFGRLNPISGAHELFRSHEHPSPPMRFNDAKVDRAGCLWAGTMNVDGQTAEGVLYRIADGRAAAAKLHNLTISNGLDWSPDNTLMYFVDTPTRRVDVFDFDLESGSIANRRTLVEIPAEHGHPDGLTVDASGALWVALYGGWAVHCYAPTGTLIGRVEVPAQNVTSCAFGGSALTDLYITTARADVTRSALLDQPLAGSLFVFPEAGFGQAPTPYQEIGVA